MNNIKVFAIIVTYNGMRWIERCIESISNSSYTISLVIIDNKSTDGTFEYLERINFNMTLIRNKKNIGFGRANNIGIKYALDKGADFVFLLNQDVYILPDTIEKLVKMNIEFPEYGLLNPVHMDGSGFNLDKNFQEFSLSNENYNMIKTKSSNPFNTSYVNAAAWLLSRECILKVGGFDPLFTHYGEDGDYCNRIQYHGFLIGVICNAKIFHDRVYCENNPYRKNYNLLLNAGLAQLKNINNTLLFDFLVWIHLRSKKSIKWLYRFNIRMFFLEIKVFFKLVIMTKKIKMHRKICTKTSMPFLT